MKQTAHIQQSQEFQCDSSVKGIELNTIQNAVLYIYSADNDNVHWGALEMRSRACM